MGMLDRYKKTGGFVQLLTLLETSGKQKQESFLKIIREENVLWADLLSSKLLSIERVFSWNDSALSEITGAMLEINVAAMLSGLNPEQRERVINSLPSIKRRKVIDFFEGSPASPGETATSISRFLETTRNLCQDGILRLDRIDPSLYIETDIEDKIKQGLIKTVDSSLEAAPPPALTVVQSSSSSELADLRKRVSILQTENTKLRQELATVQKKLEQIRKLA